MAANKTVMVLAPNGRRQTVKVTPNTTILQIIEEVCKKQGFKTEEHDVKHHKTILDINATIGFSGLPNNAQLELIPSTRARIDGDVTIGVQMENGSRLVGTFKPNDTIYDILSKLTPDDLKPNKNTVVIYMRQELFGIEIFKKTDLRSLGLTSGRAMFRLIHKAPEELKTQANISVPLPAKPTEEKPYVRKLQRVESPPRIREQELKESPPPPPPPVKDESEESIPKKACKEENVRTMQKTTTGKKTNMVELIKGEKKRQNEQKQQQKSVQDVSAIKEAIDVDEKPIEEEFLFLGERNAMLFSFETAHRVPSEELPDDFFELTIEDAKKLFRDIKKRRVELENGPLMTSALRNLEESKRQLRVINRYKKTIIRVLFPNRTVLQGTFSSTEDIGTVITFVRSYLEDKNLDFYLYTTPPKSILKNESILVEIGCVPGALLYFGVSNSQNGDFLKTDLKDKFTTSSVASLAAARMRKESRRWEFTEEPEDITITPEENSDVNVGASTSTDNYVDYDAPSTSKSQKETKVPKWFKNQ